jgi:hypothetical protein
MWRVVGRPAECAYALERFRVAVVTHECGAGDGSCDEHHRDAGRGEESRPPGPGAPLGRRARWRDSWAGDIDHTAIVTELAVMRKAWTVQLHLS